MFAVIKFVVLYLTRIGSLWRWLLLGTVVVGQRDVTQVREINPQHLPVLAGKRLRWEVIQKLVWIACQGGVSVGAAVAQLVNCRPAGIWAHWEGGTGGTGKWREMAPGGEFIAVTKGTLSQRKATAPRSPGLTAVPG